MAGKMYLNYLLNSFEKVHRSCFRFKHKLYVYRLILSQLPNKVLSEEGFSVLSEFVRG